MTQAIMRFREGGFLNLATDYDDDDMGVRQRIYY